MQIPTDVELYRTDNSTSWIDKNDILYSVSNAQTAVKEENTEKHIESLKSRLNGQRVCSLVVVSHLRNLNKEIRSYLEPEFLNVYKAIAIVTTNPWGEMFDDKLFSKSNQDYPLRVFSNEIEAKSWLEEYK